MVLRAMRGLDGEEEVKNDGKPVPAKPKMKTFGKKISTKRPVLDDVEALHEITRS